VIGDGTQRKSVKLATRELAQAPSQPFDGATGY